MYDIVDIIEKGRAIAVWSPIHRQAGVSALTAMLASYVLVNEPESRILLMSNELYGVPTSARYLTTEQLPTNLLEVVNLARAESLSSYSDLYNNCTSTIPNLDVLQSVRRSQQVQKYLSDEIESIIKVAKTGYKYIFIDTVAGTQDKATAEALKWADVVIACIPQDKFIWDNWLRKVDGTWHKNLNNKRHLLVSGVHYEYNYLNYRKLATELKGEELAWVSQNELVKASAETRSILEMVNGEIHKRKDKQDDCIRECEIIFDRVGKLLDLVREDEIKIEEEEKARIEQENADRIDSLMDMFNATYNEDDEEEEDLEDIEDIEDSVEDKEETEESSKVNGRVTEDTKKSTDKGKKDNGKKSWFGKKKEEQSNKDSEQVTDKKDIDKKNSEDSKDSKDGKKEGIFASLFGGNKADKPDKSAETVNDEGTKKESSSETFLNGLFGNKSDEILEPSKNLINLKDKDTKTYEEKAATQDHGLDSLMEPDGSSPSEELDRLAGLIEEDDDF